VAEGDRAPGITVSPIVLMQDVSSSGASAAASAQSRPIRHRSEHAGIERDRAMRIHNEREGCADGGLPDWARGNGIGHPMRYHKREISRTNPLISAALWLNCGCAVRAFPRMSSVEPRTSNLEPRSSRLDAHVSTLSRCAISSVHRRSSSRNRCPRAMSPWLAARPMPEEGGRRNGIARRGFRSHRFGVRHTFTCRGSKQATKAAAANRSSAVTMRVLGNVRSGDFEYRTADCRREGACRIE
jgi:hypothetical protein